MSVVVITPDTYQPIRRTIEHLQAQTVCHRLELLIVAPSAKPLGEDLSQLVGFWQTRIVEIGNITSTPQANAAGVLAASAPIVSFIESHAYPDPGWAEALLAAHRQAWAVVGPVVGNANPQSVLSWVDLIVGYSPWLEFAQAGMVDQLPAHNSSYKRDVLLEYEHDLETALAVEGVLHWDLRRRGYRLYLEPAARIAHVNTSRPFSLFRQFLLFGRAFAAARAQRWSPFRRLTYAAGAPFIPVVRFQRILSHLSQGEERYYRLLVRIAPLLVLALGVSALGEMTGYALGEGDAAQSMCDLDLRRERYIRRKDREALGR